MSTLGISRTQELENILEELVDFFDINSASLNTYDEADDEEMVHELDDLIDQARRILDREDPDASEEDATGYAE